MYNSIGELIENKQEGLGYEYNSAGLITRVYNLSTNNSITEYTYNDKGLKYSKTSYSGGIANIEVEQLFYVYDAGGVEVATYKKLVQIPSDVYALQHHSLFGAGRVGLLDKATGKAMYELSDHLGNVRAVVTASANGAAETISYTDYYPHGGVLPGRNYTSSLNFPYGYQGQEKDQTTGLTNFELRQYDPRIGRWYNPDPYGQHHSPYLAMSNNPVSFTDADGGRDNGFTGGVEDDFISPLQSQHIFSGDDWINNMEYKANYGIDMHNYNSYRAKYKEGTQWGSYLHEYKEEKLTNGGYSPIFIANFQYQAERPNYMSGGTAVSFFLKRNIDNDDGHVMPAYNFQKKLAAANPAIKVAVVNNFKEAADYLESLNSKQEIVNNVLFTAHGNLPSEKGTFNFGSRPIANANDVDAVSFSRIGKTMTPSGRILLIGCHTGGNKEVLGNIAKYTGKYVLAAQGLVSSFRSFINMTYDIEERTFDESQYPYLYTKKSTMAFPTPQGYSTRDINGFSSDYWGNVRIK